MDDEVKNQESEESKLQASTKNELDKYLNQEKRKDIPASFVVDPETKIQEPILGSSAVDVTNPVKQVQDKSVKKSEEASQVNPQIKPIVRTYKSDMEETIRSQHLSSLNIAVAENNKMMRRLTDESVAEEKKANKNYKIFILIIILIIAGLLAIAVPYFLVKNQFKPEPTVELPNDTSLIVSDSAEIINLDTLNKERIAKTLDERVDQLSITLGSVRRFYMTEEEASTTVQITAKRFFDLIKARVPVGIQRTLKDQFMFGMHSLKGNQKFLILKVGSYETTYAGMLSWENALWNDFSELFGLDSGVDTDSLGRPIIGEAVYKFQDIVVKNKDTRAVKNEQGEIVFLYSVVDKNTVILTTSQDTFKEILNRMDKMSVTR